MLIGFVLVLSVVLLVRLYFNRAYVTDPQLPHGARFDQLVDRIDPNIATWQELAVLPQIGESRAKEIITYREAFVARQTNAPAFADPEDLLNVKGIGPAMLATIRPHLSFPATQPTTRGL